MADMERTAQDTVEEALEAEKGTAEEAAMELETEEDIMEGSEAGGSQGEAEEGAPDQECSTSGEKKGFFKKKEKKDKRDEQIEQLTDQVKRQMAEFDNFRKRTEKEKSQMYEVGARDIIERILPVVDNFERGLAGLSEEQLGEPFADGMNMVYKQLLSALEAAGVTPIEAVGQEFDPAYHNAVMHIEDEELGENIVAEELQKGYLYRDAVVRHSMVKVAN